MQLLHERTEQRDGAQRVAVTIWWPFGGQVLMRSLKAMTRGFSGLWCFLHLSQVPAEALLKQSHMYNYLNLLGYKHLVLIAAYKGHWNEWFTLTQVWHQTYQQPWVHSRQSCSQNKPRPGQWIRLAQPTKDQMLLITHERYCYLSKTRCNNCCFGGYKYGVDTLQGLESPCGCFPCHPSHL